MHLLAYIFFFLFCPTYSQALLSVFLFLIMVPLVPGIHFFSCQFFYFNIYFNFFSFAGLFIDVSQEMPYNTFESDIFVFV